MSTYTFSEKDWPDKNEAGLAVQYRPDITKAPLERGVLHVSSTSVPSVPWYQVKDNCDIDGHSLNHVSYHISKSFSETTMEDIKRKLLKAFDLAFPNKLEPNIEIHKGQLDSQDGCYVAFATPSDIVLASEIVSAAYLFRWRANGHHLGRPWFVGFATEKPFYPLRFINIPDNRKQSFIANLPNIITKELDPRVVIQIVDIWEHQSRASDRSGWTFKGIIDALVCIEQVPSHETRIDSVQRWPGWIHFENECVIKLVYPDRFEFCKFCKHTAQDLDEAGPNRRHKYEACIRIICEECGHCGHDVKSDKPDPTGYNKQACEDGRKRRHEEEEEVRKRRKLEEEAQKKKDEEARKEIEEEDARSQGQEERESAVKGELQDSTNGAEQSDLPDEVSEQAEGVSVNADEEHRNDGKRDGETAEEDDEQSDTVEDDSVVTTEAST